MALLLLLAGCDEATAQYPPLPIRVTVQLKSGDMLRCEDKVIRIGLPTDNGWVTIITFGKRDLECKIVPALPPLSWTKTKVTQWSD